MQTKWPRTFSVGSYHLGTMKKTMNKNGPLQNIHNIWSKRHRTVLTNRLFFFFWITLIRLNMQLMYRESDSLQPAAARQGERGINNFLNLDHRHPRHPLPPPNHHHRHQRHRARSPSASLTNGTNEIGPQRATRPLGQGLQFTLSRLASDLWPRPERWLEVRERPWPSSLKMTAFCEARQAESEGRRKGSGGGMLFCDFLILCKAKKTDTTTCSTRPPYVTC